MLVRTAWGDWLHVPPLDLIGRTTIGHSATWHPTGRAFWTLNTKPTLPERGEDWVDAPNGSLWDASLLKPLYIEALTESRSLVVEVGANLGTGAVYCGRRGATVLAVEPYQPTYEILLRNVAANGLEDRVFPLQWVAHEREGRFAPRLEPESTGYSDEITLGQVEYSPTTGEGAVGGPLDAVVPMYSLGRRVTLVKTDVQGSDLAALRGLRRTILEHKPVIVFECEPKHGIPVAEYEHYLGELGYCVEASVQEDNYVGRVR